MALKEERTDLLIPNEFRAMTLIFFVLDKIKAKTNANNVSRLISLLHQEAKNESLDNLVYLGSFLYNLQPNHKLIKEKYLKEMEKLAKSDETIKNIMGVLK